MTIDTLIVLMLGAICVLLWQTLSTINMLHKNIKHSQAINTALQDLFESPGIENESASTDHHGHKSGAGSN